MRDPTWLEEAEEYFRKGYEAQMHGDLEQEAVSELKRAFEIELSHVAARRELHRLLGLLN